MASPQVNPPREQLILLNDELRGRAALQSDEMEGLDRKASTMVAGAGVVLGLVINNVDQFDTAAFLPRNLFFLSLIVLACALVAGGFAVWPRRVKVIPSPRGLVEGYYAREHDDTLANLVSTRLRASELNKNLSAGKVCALKAQVILFGAGVAGLVLAYVLKEWR